MDKKDFAEVEDRLLEVNKVIAKLDSSIRVAAFDFLKSYVTSGVVTSHAENKKHPVDHSSSTDESELIQKYGDGKPHENVNLLAAIWFGEYGSNPFSMEYVREKADATGLTIPASPRMTLRQAKEKGKSLYVPAGRGLFKPTVVGEAFLKATYSVKKGTKTPPVEK